MRESRPYGSVRGALSNERPYRDYMKFNAGDVIRDSRHCERSVAIQRLRKTEV